MPNMKWRSDGSPCSPVIEEAVTSPRLEKLLGKGILTREIQTLESGYDDWSDEDGATAGGMEAQPLFRDGDGSGNFGPPPVILLNKKKAGKQGPQPSVGGLGEDDHRGEGGGHTASDATDDYSPVRTCLWSALAETQPCAIFFCPFPPLTSWCLV